MIPPGQALEFHTLQGTGEFLSQEQTEEFLSLEQTWEFLSLEQTQRFDSLESALDGGTNEWSASLNFDIRPALLDKTFSGQ